MVGPAGLPPLTPPPFRLFTDAGPAAGFAGLVLIIRPAILVRGVTPKLAAGGNLNGAIVTPGGAVSGSFGFGPGLPVVGRRDGSPGRTGVKGSPGIDHGLGIDGIGVAQGTVRRHELGGGVGRNYQPIDYHRFPTAFLFFLGKLKNNGYRLPGNARLAIGQPSLLRGDKAAERAAFPPIDRIIPLVAILAGGPGFRLAESVRLVDAAVEGLAPVLSQGFQNGGGTVGVGKGLPVGAVPRDGTGLQRGCPPPLLQRLRLTRQWPRLPCVGT